MKRHNVYLLASLISVLAVTSFDQTGSRRQGQGPQPKLVRQPGPDLNARTRAYGLLPLSFEANQGQATSKVKFLSRGEGYELFLTSRAAVFTLESENAPDIVSGHGSASENSNAVTSNAVLQMELVKSRPDARVEGLDELPGKANYFIGNDSSKWHTGIPTYSKVRYSGVYPGIDLLYYGNRRRLEYDLVVAPHADPQQIELKIRGPQELRIDHGDLVLSTLSGETRFQKPTLYQEAGATRQMVNGSFVLLGDNKVGFHVGQYDPSKTLVIDPQLVYSTYLGGSGIGGDIGNGIALDSSGNAYVAGKTKSTDFPTTSGALKTSFGTGVASNAFVAKLNSTGTALIYSTYLGGSASSDFDNAEGIAVDSSGNAYVTGRTTSADFPTTSGVFQAAIPGGAAGFVTKLNTTGTALVYSTYLGGSSFDETTAIAVDTAGHAYVTGQVSSSDFPVTAGAFQATPGSTSDAFVTEFNASGTTLMYSSFLGGEAIDRGTGIAVDSAGNAYVTGSTNSGHFPTTAGVFQPLLGNLAFSNAFVTKVNPTGTALIYSTYLGGTSDDAPAGIAVDSSGNAYVTGFASSNDFPTTAGSLQPSKTGGAPAFVTKFNATGTALAYSTFLGGPSNSEDDVPAGIAVDSAGNAYVTGMSQNNDFPTTPGAFQTSPGGFNDTFVSTLNPTGSALLYSTYLGGTDTETAGGIAVDASQNIYVTGETASTDFPVSAGAFQITNNSPNRGNVYVTKLTPPAVAVAGATPSPTSLTFASQLVNTTSASQPVILTNTGAAALTVSAVSVTGDFAEADNCVISSPIAPSGTCTAHVTFTPSTTGLRNGTLSFTDDAANSPQTVSLSGTGANGTPVAGLSSNNLTFSGQVVGTSSTAQSVTLGNTGNAALSITGISISGANAADFTQTNTCGSSVSAGSNCTISVTFRPSAAGSRTATVGIADNASASPQTVNLSGTGSDFSASSSPSTMAVKAGASASFTITITPGTGGFANAVALSASGLPGKSTGSFSAPSVTPGSNTVTSTLTIDTTSTRAASASAAVSSDRSRPNRVPPLLAALLFGLPLMVGVGSQCRRKTIRRLCALVLLAGTLAFTAVMSGCNGGFPGASPGTPAGSYTITVTATSASLQHSATMTLTVQ